MSSLRQIALLLFKQLTGTLSAPEQEELMRWVNSGADRERWYKTLSNPAKLEQELRREQDEQSNTWKKIIKKTAAKSTDAWQSGEDDNAYRLAYLVSGHLQAELSLLEESELEQWVAASENNMILFEQLTEENRAGDKKAPDQWAASKTRRGTGKKKPRLLRIFSWPLWVAAACVLLVVVVLFLHPFETRQPEINTPPPSALADFQPASWRARLTVGANRSMVLDSAGAWTNALRQGPDSLSRKPGWLQYERAGTRKANAVEYHLLETPRGGQYALVLSDGTRVWLNAASSLRYPVPFFGNTRELALSGEAYFEVAKDDRHPFVLTTPHGRVQVTGTHFNVDAYAENMTDRVCLLEGRVRVSTTANPSNPMALVPGEAAAIGEQLSLSRRVDTAMIMAWKNGLFEFHGTPLTTVMEQISRWYDVNVTYEKGIPNHLFTGKISRQSNASQVLQMLEYAGLHFRMRNREIIVLK